MCLGVSSSPFRDGERLIRALVHSPVTHVRFAEDPDADVGWTDSYEWYYRAIAQLSHLCDLEVSITGRGLGSMTDTAFEYLMRRPYITRRVNVMRASAHHFLAVDVASLPIVSSVLMRAYSVDDLRDFLEAVLRPGTSVEKLEFVFFRMDVVERDWASVCGSLCALISYARQLGVVITMPGYTHLYVADEDACVVLEQDVAVYLDQLRDAFPFGMFGECLARACRVRSSFHSGGYLTTSFRTTTVAGINLESFDVRVFHRLLHRDFLDSRFRFTVTFDAEDLSDDAEKGMCLVAAQRCSSGKQQIPLAVCLRRGDSRRATVVQNFLHENGLPVARYANMMCIPSLTISFF